MPPEENAGDEAAPAAATAVDRSGPVDGAGAAGATAPSEPSPEAGAELPKPRPKGEPENVVALREMVERKLQDITGSYVVDPHGNYVLGFATARIFVVPTWIESGSVILRVFAITNLDVPVTAELTRYLLEKNLEFVFGGFALDGEAGAVWFNHNILGDFLSPEELEATIAAVAQTADRYDDEIKQRFGGRLYVESEDEKIPTPATPGYL